MMKELLILVLISLVCEAAIDSTGCPVEFKGLCICESTTSRYDNYKEKLYTVNCTNAGFTDTRMLMHLPEKTQVLIFVGNNINSLPSNVINNFKDYEYLDTIDMSNNHIRFISGKSFHKVYNVRTLILDHNDMDIAGDSTRPRIFSNFESLERLHMTNAFTEKVNSSEYLLSLEDIFFQSKLDYLKVLHLEQNEIWDIGINKKVFCQLPALEQVLLGDNRLSDFDFSIDCLPYLRYIDLERNMISRLSDEAMTRLDDYMEKKSGLILQIKLEDNPFDCDCRSNHFLQWLDTTKVKVIGWEDYSCVAGYPEINKGKTFDQVQDLRCPRYSDGHEHHTTGGHSSAAVGILAFFLVFTTSMLMAVAYFHRKKMKDLFSPYFDAITRKIGYTGIANEETPQEVNL